MSDTLHWNLWVWEQPSWRVLASYSTWAEAKQAARRTADPADTLCICKAGGPRDEYLRHHCGVRGANSASLPGRRA